MKPNLKNDLILKLRKLAGEIGELENDFLYASDAGNYDFHVKAGMAESVVDILKYDTAEIIRWFGFCLVVRGVESDPRIDALLNALGREVAIQLDADDGGGEELTADESVS